MAPLSRHILTGGIANINVGPDEVPYDAHIELLCSLSPFFENALNGRFIEAETKIIPLPDDDPDTFAEFLGWMYSGKIFESNENPGWLELSRLWVMADKFGVPQLQNDTMSLFPNKFRKMSRVGNVHPAVLDFVYENTIPESPLRRMIVDVCSWGMEVDKFEKHRQDMPGEFLEDFGLMQMKKNNGYYKGTKAPFETYVPRYFVKVTPSSPKLSSSPPFETCIKTPETTSGRRSEPATPATTVSPNRSTTLPNTPSQASSSASTPSHQNLSGNSRRKYKVKLPSKRSSERPKSTPRSRIDRADWNKSSIASSLSSSPVPRSKDFAEGITQQVEALSKDLDDILLHRQ